MLVYKYLINKKLMSALFDLYLGFADLTRTYSLSQFVETGCYMGEGLSYAQQVGYVNMYSCDIDNTRVVDCQSKFPNSVILHQESVSFLEQVLPQVHGATMFWLDAHYPADYGQVESVETKFPVIEEILRIKKYKSNYQQDVIIIDDIRVLDSPDNPLINPSIGEYYMIDLSIQQLALLLSDTHRHYLAHTDTGNLIFVPKY